MRDVNMVDGCFDPIHPGHILYFKKASEVGGPLFCNVTGDEYLKNKHKPLLDHEKRCQIIDSIKYIDFTYQSPHSTAFVLEILKPKHYIKGNDWLNRGIEKKEKEICSQFNIKILFLDSVIDSSSKILEEYLNEK
jgi:FAD synthetase